MRARIVSFLIVSILISVCPKVCASEVCVKDHCVQVEVVSAAEDMQRGLQGRESLSDGCGMLFMFQEDDFQSFWMKGMKFAIDMVWIDEQYRIVTVSEKRQPCVKDPCEIYTPSKKARYVLEVPAGYALTHQFHEGDVVEFKLGGHNT